VFSQGSSLGAGFSGGKKYLYLYHVDENKYGNHGGQYSNTSSQNGYVSIVSF
jgi:hypothetical protein